jgi:hypothetical protein
MAGYAAQARREINRMYRPATKSLNRQEKKIKSLDKKHARDEKAYQSWLASTNAALNAEAAKRDGALASQEAGYHQQLQQNLGAADRMAGQMGTAFGVAGGIPPAADTDGRTSAMRAAEMAGPRTPLLDSVAMAQSARFGGSLAGAQRRGLDLSQSTEKNTYAQVALMKAQRKSQTLEALSELAKQRGDLQMQKAADTAKRVADMEAAAAEAAQRAFENNMQMMKMEQEAMQFEANLGMDQDRLALDTWEARSQARDRRAGRRLDRLGLKAKGKGGSGGKPYTANQRESGRAAFDFNTALAGRRIARGRKINKGASGLSEKYLHSWLVKAQADTAPENRLSSDVLRVVAKRAKGKRPLSKGDYDLLRRAGIRVA